MTYIILALLFPLIAFDWILDVNYKWWRRRLGEKPRQS